VLDELSPSLPLDAAARLILRALYAEVVAPVPAVLRGDDTASVHDMRVAIRRLRSAMSAFRECFPKKRWSSARSRMRRLGRKLGEIRDADVHLGALRGRLGGASLDERPGVTAALDHLRERRRRALGELAVELSQFDRDAFVELFA
jgi:CHAD domain-containing protein